MVINHLLTGVILQVTDELRWIWDFLVFYVHSRKELTARLLKKWWRRETIRLRFGANCLFSGANCANCYFQRGYNSTLSKCQLNLKHVETFYGPKNDEWLPSTKRWVNLSSSSPAPKIPTTVNSNYCKILPGRGKRPNYRLLKKFQIRVQLKTVDPWIDFYEVNIRTRSFPWIP